MAALLGLGKLHGRPKEPRLPFLPQVLLGLVIQHPDDVVGDADVLEGLQPAPEDVAAAPPADGDVLADHDAVGQRQHHLEAVHAPFACHSSDEGKRRHHASQHAWGVGGSGEETMGSIDGPWRGDEGALTPHLVVDGDLLQKPDEVGIDVALGKRLHLIVATGGGREPPKRNLLLLLLLLLL